MSRVQRHVLPSADLLLRLQGVRLVRNKNRDMADPPHRPFLHYHTNHYTCFLSTTGVSTSRATSADVSVTLVSTDITEDLNHCFVLLIPHCVVFVSVRVQRGHSQKMHRQSHRQMHRVSHQQQGNDGECVTVSY